MSLEPDIAETFLYSTLRALPALAGIGIHNTIVTPTIANPGGDRVVIFQFQGGNRRTGIGNVDQWSDLVYLVKVIDKTTSYTTSKPIRAAIGAALESARATTADGTVIACMSDTPIRYVEIHNGVQYRHVGTTWRLYVQGVYPP
jgi:hypothetical protein